MSYKVKRATGAVKLDDNWDDGQWKEADVIEIAKHMGQKPEHFPKSQAKVLYDDDNLYVFFRVEDQYVRAVAEKTHDMVCGDSCVEFFFTPREKELQDEYFNIEVNCGGTILMDYGDNGRKGRKPLDVEDCRMIEMYHSMPKIVEPEISEPKTWFIQYRLPVALLEKYTSVEKPRPGAAWKANFYKCGDNTSHPHWLTWALVDLPAPDFHQPAYFAPIEFE